MQKLNTYESPEVLILELEKKDIITTSTGTGPVVKDDWEW